MSWVVAIGIAAACAALEALLSGRAPFKFLQTLKQPSWALPIWGWMAVGGLFYVVMTVGLAQTLEVGGVSSLPAILIVLVLLTDGFWNFLLFRLRRFDWAYWYLFPYALLVILACLATFSVDAVSGALIALYVVFLPYDFAWARALQLMNRSGPASSSI